MDMAQRSVDALGGLGFDVAVSLVGIAFQAFHSTPNRDALEAGNLGSSNAAGRTLG